MTIGYSVEGSTDRALLKGLHDRWCPHVDMVEGHFRGTSGTSRRREISKVCEEFVLKGVDAMVFTTDANDRPWREVKREEQGRFPPARLSLAVVGVADRNVECWICRDAAYVAERLGGIADAFSVADPKSAFEAAIGVTRDDRKEPEIATLVREAPLGRWLNNPSFADFYEQLRDVSQRSGCVIENLRETTGRA
jgi:hypothetical protein